MKYVGLLGALLLKNSILFLSNSSRNETNCQMKSDEFISKVNQSLGAQSIAPAVAEAEEKEENTAE